MTELANSNNQPFDEKQKNRIRLYYKMWEDDPEGFANSHGAEGVNQLSELMRRLNAQSSDTASGHEQVATNHMANALEEQMDNPQSDTDKTKVTNPFKQVTHGGAQGFGLLWNGIVDFGRGAIDPENHAKYLDLAFNNRFVTSNKQRRGAIERMFEGWKKDAVAGKKGFKSAWMRSVLEEDEIGKYGMFLTGDARTHGDGLMEGGAWLKFDEIPYANEDLGMLGAAASIAVQEAVTIGPLAVLKLLRASKVARYFATKAGGKIQKSEVVEKMGKRKFRSGKVRSELQGADYEDYLSMMKALPKGEQKRKRRLMDIYQSEGKFIKRAPFMGGGGAYVEAELISSGMVVAGGITAQTYFGKEYSVIGEVGGGIMGPRLATKAVQQAGDWFTYLRYKLPGDTIEKDKKILKSMGYTELDIEDMPTERKRKIVDQATSMPIFGGVLGFGDLRGKDRRSLDAYRHMEKEFMSMPDDIKDKLMERADAMRTIIDKFDDGSGALYTTIDRAMDMAWLATIRQMARSRMRLGNTVTAKFDVTDRVMAEKEIENAEALNKLLKQLGNNKFGKTANYEVFLDGIRHQLQTHLKRLADDKTEISKQANVILDEIAVVNNPKMNQVFDYTDPDAYAYNFSTGQIDKNSYRGIKQVMDADGNMVDELDELGMPVREDVDAASQFNKDSVNEQAIDLGNANKREEILNREGAKFVDVTLPDGTTKKILSPKSRLTQADINENAEGAKNFMENLKKTADNEARNAYNTVEGLNVSTLKTGSAISNQQVDSIITRMAEKLLQISDEVPSSLRPVINDGSKGMKDTSINRYFTNKRQGGLSRLRKQLNDDNKFIEEMETLLDGTNVKIEPDDFKRIDVDPITGKETLTNEIDPEKVTQLVNHVAGQLDISLLKEGVTEIKLDISLGQLAKIRTSLYQNATKQITTDGQRVSGMYNFRMGSVLTDEFDNIDSFKEANGFWRETVHRPYREGIGRLLVENPNISGDMLFQQFVKPKGGAYTSAKEDFLSLFTRGDGTISPMAKDYLTKATQQMADEGKSIPDAFFRAFGDVLDTPYKSDDMVASGREAFRKFSQKESNITKQLDSLNKNSQLKVRANEKQFQIFAGLNPEFNPFGVPTETLSQLFGREALDASSLRQAIIRDTYEGGDPARVQAVAKYINNIPESKMVTVQVEDINNPGKFITQKISQRKIAQKTLQRTLWDGAIEETYRRRSTNGVGYVQEAVKIADDGTPMGVEKGRLFESWEVDSGAMQIYLERNRKVLGEILTPDDYEDLQDLAGLTTLITADMGKQAVENFPTGLSAQSIMSRVYGVARSVISPRYVITELLIQDARFRRGNLIKDMATDPDSFALLTDVLFKEGFANPRIRTEFAQKWLGTMARYTKTMNMEEINQTSEYAWEESGN